MSLRAPLVGWTILALLVVAAPAQAAPVSGQLSMSGGAILDGAITWSGSTGLIDLDADDGIPPFLVALNADTAEVFVERQTSDPATSLLFDDAVRQAQTTPETLADIELRDMRLHDGARVTLELAEADVTAATTHAVLDAAPQVYASVDPHDQVRLNNPRFDYSIAGQDWIVGRADDLDVQSAGEIVMAFWNVEVRLDTADGERAYRAGTWTEQDDDALLPTEQEVFQIVWIRLQNAELSLSWTGDATIAGPAPRIDIDGVTTMTGTRGSLLVDTIGVRPSVQDVEVSGAYAMSPVVDRTAAAESAPGTQLITHYDRFDSGIRGSADRVEVSGRLVAIPDEGVGAAVAAGAAGVGIVAALAAAYRWGPLALAALYSRLEQGQLLENETRAQIYEIVKRNPGISARQIHRLSTASWGTVVHHLNKLHGAGYVAARSHGRAKCYYENHGKWDAFQEQLAVLTGEKTAAVADAIAAVPGRDQNQIMTRTGFSQSTVSYHLLKLEKAGLITKDRTGTSLAYFPTASLRDLRARLPTHTLTPDPATIGGAA